MKNKKCDDKYDVIIIGAGLGGLISANYLAKSSFKTLVVEQHFIPGGCCTSFRRKGFTFDAGGHFVGSCCENGIMYNILKNIGLKANDIFINVDPIDKLFFPDFSITIKKNFGETAAELVEIFPDEAENIKEFINKIKSFNYSNSFHYINKTFKDVLDQYFSDKKLKAVFDILLLYIGLSSARVSAISAFMLYREFILDGGYYPKGSMQQLSNTLAKNFEDFGGDILLSSKIIKINIENDKAAGVTLDNGNTIKADYIISNAAALQTFLELVGKRYLKPGFVKRLEKMKMSASHFIVYLGINRELKEDLKDKCNSWYIPGYDIEKIYIDMIGDNIFDNDGFIHLAFPSFYDSSLAPEGNDSVFLTVLAPYKNKEYWDESKQNFAEMVIKRAEKILPGLSKNIVVKEISTPHTIERYTLNTMGANYGWELTPFQSGKMRLSQETPVKNLYLAGHWTQLGPGLATVAQSGLAAARLIISDNRGVKK